MLIRGFSWGILEFAPYYDLISNIIRETHIRYTLCSLSFLRDYLPLEKGNWVCRSKAKRRCPTFSCTIYICNMSICSFSFCFPVDYSFFRVVAPLRYQDLFGCLSSSVQALVCKSICSSGLCLNNTCKTCSASPPSFSLLPHLKELWMNLQCLSSLSTNSTFLSFLCWGLSSHIWAN